MNKKCIENFGDAFTKIGGGIFGGITVSYYYNTFILNNPPKNLSHTYYLMIFFAVLLLTFGYFLMNYSKNIEQKDNELS